MEDGVVMDDIRVRRNRNRTDWYGTSIVLLPSCFLEILCWVQCRHARDVESGQDGLQAYLQV